MSQHAEVRELSETESRIIDAAIEAVLKFGPRKTTMNDIAEIAGLTRQTVYVGFRNKDNVLAEMVRYIGRRQLNQLAVAWEYCPNLAEKLQAYARIVVLDAAEDIDAEQDPQELVADHNEAGRVAYLDVCERHADMWAGQLSDREEELHRQGMTPLRLARFIVTTSLNLKRTERDRGALHDQLNVLSASVLAMAARK